MAGRTSVGLASVPGSPASSPPDSPVPPEQVMRDARVILPPWPSQLGVPPPAGVPVASPIPRSRRSPDPASPQRPPSYARHDLAPYDSGPSSPAHGEAPASRGSSAASPVADAAYPLTDDHGLSDDVAVSSPPPVTESSPVVLLGAPVSSASSPSPPASMDEAAVVPDERDDIPEQPESDTATLLLPRDHTHLLEDQAHLLRSLWRDRTPTSRGLAARKLGRRPSPLLSRRCVFHRCDIFHREAMSIRLQH
ncbi:hypothetical protein HPB51_027886 [Rhipicephalus microplus]|uniref:Uncharacterized protein n=1 Tax=Rhipicephalus microplus TaxID=6941 RepID=A0A9J6CZA3_RHIMP|nr:hypothetical protein HPB51_027886 [Rhipicephalus microplus]